MASSPRWKRISISREPSSSSSADPVAAPELCLGLTADILDPTEDLLDALADTLADGIAGMPGGAVVDLGFAPLAGLGEVVLHRHMGRHLALAEFIDKTRDVEALVPAQRDPPLAPLGIHGTMLVDHVKGGFAFRRARRHLLGTMSKGDGRIMTR